MTDVYEIEDGDVLDRPLVSDPETGPVPPDQPDPDQGSARSKFLTEKAEEDAVRAKSLERAQEVISELDVRYQKFEEFAGRSNRQLWHLLGRIHALAEEFDRGQDSLQLAVELSRRGKIVSGARWASSSPSGKELLVVSVLGLRKETKATKHQWLKALKAAEAESVPRNEEKFVAWIAKKGGMIEAGRLAPKGPGKKAKFSLPKFVESIPQFARERTQLVDFGDPFPVHEGLSLVLVQSTIGGFAESKVVEFVKDSKLIERVAREIQEAWKKRSKAEADALAALNLYALGAADYWPLPKLKEVKAFVAAASALASDEVLRRTYFDDDPVIPNAIDGLDRKNCFPVINPEFHELDPARYIGGAKPGALMPYTLPAMTLREMRDAKHPALQAITEHWTRRPGEQSSTS